ncbi:hypothetical protein BKH13_00450 [Actinomyces naeslundii]|uniref:Peptidase M41 domain-containing protein n=1 Tax=Actinomyces naeslundii TaxID=1655 RepID=A0ABX3F293_ACTNA|nr:hypothetical protein [Actinomyces naeslundii]OLO86356.1 hypothetical protein BKH13_00450 [Actinomyces naeslundii]
MINWPHLLRRAATNGLLIWIFLTYFDDLIAVLKMFIAASPSTRAQFVSLTVISLVAGYALWTLIKVVFSEVVDLIKHRLGTSDDTPVLRSTREIYAKIHKREGESTKDAVKRLRPVWDEANSSKYAGSHQQTRRHEAAHVVVAWAQGGTVLSVNTHRRLDRDGHYKELIPLPHPGAAKVSWYRTQVYLAGLAQDVLDGCEAHGSGTDIDSALRAAVVLAATGWRPDGYTGPLNPSDLITHAIETNKQILTEHQNAIAAIETALSDKDELTGVEVHQILNNLNTPDLELAVEVDG